MSAPTNSGIQFGFVQHEDGSLQKVVATATPYYTFAEAVAAYDHLQDGSAKQAAREKLDPVRNAAVSRIAGAAMERAERYNAEVNDAARLTDGHMATVRDLIEKLNRGSVTSADAARQFDQIVHTQQGLNRRVETWQRGIAEAVSHYTDPLKAHDDLVRRMPALREGRPLVCF